jgi:hydroxypyruvate reductase
MGQQEYSFMNKVMIRNGQIGSDASDILNHALRAVDPYSCVFNQVNLDQRQLIIGQTVLSLNQFNRVFLLGIGKAAVPMAKALIDKLGSILSLATVLTKDQKYLSENGYQGKLTVHLGGHPVPTEGSVQSTKLLMSSLPVLYETDLVLLVISGGGSALFTNPVPGVTVENLKRLTQILLHCGADINEINTIRKHLDQVKGGQLAMKLQPAHVEALILSDVIGDRLDVIASGPTVPDPTTFQDALNILIRYGVLDQVPHEILNHLEKGRDGLIPETLKPGQLPSDKVNNDLVGTNFLAAKAAYKHAILLGYHAVIISTAVTGLTEHVADFIEGVIQTGLLHDHPVAKPACIIFGGEPTVNVTGDGLGGRNMDLCLRLVSRLAEKYGVLFISLATDGEDGPTDAAGAAVDGAVFREGEEQFGLNIEKYVSNNDAYHYHEIVGGLIKTGATGTNVNDLMLLLIERPS